LHEDRWRLAATSCRALGSDRTLEATETSVDRELAEVSMGLPGDGTSFSGLEESVQVSEALEGRPGSPGLL